MKRFVKRAKQNKNLTIFNLLLRVPEFKKDIEIIRKDFQIKKDGFKWGGKELLNWGVKQDIWYYQIDEDEDPSDWSLVSDMDTRKNFPSNKFEERLYELGSKYKLPFNFYGFAYRGLARFILSNYVDEPPRNYDIDFRDSKSGGFVWTSLVIYAPLTKTEAKEAMKNLENTQYDLLPNFYEGIDAIGKKRFGNNVERDLALLDEQITRSGKPKRIRKITSGSYLDFVNKSKSLSVAEKKKALKNNKHDITVGYSSPTSKEIGKKRNVSASVARQAKHRSNSLAKELFGYDLES